MKVRAWAIGGVLALLCLVFSMLSVGGAAQVQPAVGAQARAESPLAQTYIVLDRHASALVPAIGRLSRSLADACFGDTWAAIEADPEIGLHLLLTTSRGSLATLARTCYWATPVLLLLSLILYFLRPKPVHLIRS